jgi:glucan phosphoethanolaminetransferase (alkaline phosphatase superfamily)
MRGQFGELLAILKQELAAKNWTLLLFVGNVLFWLIVCILAAITVCVALWRDHTLKKKQTVFILLAAALVLYFAVLTGPVSFPRYRLPAEPFMFTLAATAFVFAYTYLKQRRTRNS